MSRLTLRQRAEINRRLGTVRWMVEDGAVVLLPARLRRPGQARKPTGITVVDGEINWGDQA